jgi:alcohol dehydrogenase (cytochrome c)
MTTSKKCTFFLFSVVLLGIVIAAVPSLRWRAHISLLFIAGKIPDISYPDFFTMLSPTSGQSLTRIIESRDPHAVIHNLKTSAQDLRSGGNDFNGKCAACHGVDGKGTARAPSLVARAYKHGQSDWALYRTIRHGVAGTLMPAHELSSDAIWRLAAYVKSLDLEGQKEAQTLHAAPKPAFDPITSEELVSTAEAGTQWLTYSGSYSGTRHSALKRIDEKNASTLGVKWIRQFDGETSVIECSPIIRGRHVFITLPSGIVMALDAIDGHVLWQHASAAAATNRGAAIFGDKVFIGTGDVKVVALSAQTGAVIWEKSLVDKSLAEKNGYRITGAPLAYRGLIVTGVATIRGGRGFVAALDAATGKEKWRFYTIPEKGQAGNDSWAGDSWKEGGAPTWLTGSYDAADDVLYWGVGNPKPDYNVAERKGDNLYSNSVIALRGATGQLLWHFQFTPADDHDWDANQIPILVDRHLKEGVQKQLLWANRNGFYYVLNRENGKFLLAAPFAKQTWADGIDATGRPIPHLEPTLGRKGVLIYPGNIGATNWWSPTYDPASNLMIVPTIEQGMIYFPQDDKSETPSSSVSYPSGAGRSLYTSLRAIDATTGKIVWEKRNPSRIDDGATGSVLSTAAGLVFGSDQSTFFALKSKNGQALWSFETGGLISAAPVTFNIEGEQVVAVIAGKSLMVFGLPALENAEPKKQVLAHNPL